MSTVQEPATPPVRHPVLLELGKAALIALLTAVITSYANQQVLVERLNHLQTDLTTTKARVDQIYRDIYCPLGRCPPPPPGGQH